MQRPEVGQQLQRSEVAEQPIQAPAAEVAEQPILAPVEVAEQPIQAPVEVAEQPIIAPAVNILREQQREEALNNIVALIRVALNDQSDLLQVKLETTLRSMSATTGELSNAITKLETNMTTVDQKLTANIAI